MSAVNITVGTMAPIGTTLPVGADGDAVDRAMLVQSFQPLLNSLAYACQAAQQFFDAGGGGFVVPNLFTIDSVAGKLLRFNSLVLEEEATDGGEVRVEGADGLLVTNDINAGGRVSGMSAITQGAYGVTSFFAYTIKHVYGTPPAGGTVWQILANPPAGDAFSAWSMTFVNFSSFAVAVKDPSGTTIQSILSGSGQIYAVTVAWNGSAWVRINQQWQP